MLYCSCDLVFDETFAATVPDTVGVSLLFDNFTSICGTKAAIRLKFGFPSKSLHQASNLASGSHVLDFLYSTSSQCSKCSFPSMLWKQYVLSTPFLQLASNLIFFMLAEDSFESHTFFLKEKKLGLILFYPVEAQDAAFLLRA